MPLHDMFSCQHRELTYAQERVIRLKQPLDVKQKKDRETNTSKDVPTDDGGDGDKKEIHLVVAAAEEEAAVVVVVQQHITHISGTLWDASILMAYYLHAVLPHASSSWETSQQRIDYVDENMNILTNPCKGSPSRLSRCSKSDSLCNVCYRSRDQSPERRGKKKRCTLIELGAGTALPSVVAHRLGHAVVITDFAESLHFARETMERNGLSHRAQENAASNEKQTKENPSVSYQPLVWGRDNTLALLSTFTSWNATGNVTKPHFDYILASDVVYNPTYLNDLIDTFCVLCSPYTSPFQLLDQNPRTMSSTECKPRRTRLLIAFEQRKKSLRSFFATMKDRGFHARLISDHDAIVYARNECNLFLYEFTPQEMEE